LYKKLRKNNIFFGLAMFFALAIFFLASRFGCSFHSRPRVGLFAPVPPFPSGNGGTSAAIPLAIAP
jgi:hypothetical protein